jgi:hypothetical protein
MRTGAISPLSKADTKREVEAKLGTPEDWIGRCRAFNWSGPLLADFHDSWAWHYGSLCVRFPQPDLPRRYGLPGISLFYDMIGEAMFPPPFEELPKKRFTLGGLIELLQFNHIQFNDNRGDQPGQKPVIVSEGAVGVITLHCKRSPNAEVIYLYPHEYTCA